jgi:hypothetical protein
MKMNVHYFLALFIPVLLSVSFCYAQENKELEKKYNFSPLQNKIQSWVDSGYYNGASSSL